MGVPPTAVWPGEGNQVFKSKVFAESILVGAQGLWTHPKVIHTYSLYVYADTTSTTLTPAVSQSQGNTCSDPNNKIQANIVKTLPKDKFAPVERNSNETNKS